MSDHSGDSDYHTTSDYLEYSKYRWYTVDVDSTVVLPFNLEALRGPWIDVDRDDRKKAKETAGDAVVNYESFIITSLRLLDLLSHWPSGGSVAHFASKAVSNEAFYHLPVTHLLASQIRVTQNNYSYAVALGSHHYSCIGKFFGDIFEKLVFEIFERKRRQVGGDWDRVRSDEIRSQLDDLGAIPRIDSVKENLTCFVIRVHKILKRQARHNIGTPDKRKAQILEDLGFSQMTTTTVCLDFVLWQIRHPATSHKYLLEIFAVFGKQHMRLPIVLDAYYRDLPPWMIHHSREVCEAQQSERWYQMVGALLVDYRNLSPDANLNLQHLKRLYKKFYLCPFQ